MNHVPSQLQIGRDLPIEMRRSEGVGGNGVLENQLAVFVFNSHVEHFVVYSFSLGIKSQHARMQRLPRLINVLVGIEHEKAAGIKLNGSINRTCDQAALHADN